MQFTLEGTDRIEGWVSDTTGTWTAYLSGDRAIFDGKKRLAPYVGQYTILIPGTNGNGSLPAGDGCATVTVSKSGSIRLSGSLADGTKISQSAPLSAYGEWPLYISLYSAKGSLISWLSFSGTGTTNRMLSGDMRWLKPSLKTTYYSTGFALAISAWGQGYLPPSRSGKVLNLTEANLIFSEGDLRLTNRIQLGAGTKVTDLTKTNKLSLSFVTSSGAFSGRVLRPGTKQYVSFNGVVLQDTNFGSGFYLGTNKSGTVRLR